MKRNHIMILFAVLAAFAAAAAASTPAALGIYVTDGTNPLAEVNVNVNAVSGGYSGSGITDAGGSVTITALTPAEYIVTLAKPGYYQTTFPLYVTASAGTTTWKSGTMALNTSASANQKPLGMDYISLDPNPFSPRHGGLSINYILDSEATGRVKTSITVFNMQDIAIRKLVRDEYRSVGQPMNSDIWDGKDDNGKPASNGRYILQFLLDDGTTKKQELYEIVLIK